jgi:hypothetical protein
MSVTRVLFPSATVRTHDIGAALEVVLNDSAWVMPFEIPHG